MLTDRQRQTLNFIRSYIDEYGYPPKLKEIGDHLGITSRGTVHRYIRALEEENLIRVSTGRSRGIELVKNEDHHPNQQNKKLHWDLEHAIKDEAHPALSH